MAFKYDALLQSNADIACQPGTNALCLQGTCKGSGGFPPAGFPWKASCCADFARCRKRLMTLMARLGIDPGGVGKGLAVDCKICSFGAQDPSESEPEDEVEDPIPAAQRICSQSLRNCWVEKLKV